MILTVEKNSGYPLLLPPSPPPLPLLLSLCINLFSLLILPLITFILLHA